jgi:tetratricopeptide (TPR) repeat protein
MIPPTEYRPLECDVGMLLSVLPLLLLLQGPPPPAERAPLAELLELAQRRLVASDRNGARRELTRALALYPGSPAVRNFLGVVDAEDGNYRAAEVRFREAVERAPQYTDAFLNLGRLYQENAGKDADAVRKALAVYEKILEYQPDHAEARYQDAVLLRLLGEFGRSLEQLGRLPPADQERTNTLAVRCADHAGRGERAEADRACEKLLARRDLAEADVLPILPTLAVHNRGDLALRLLEELHARGLASAEGRRRLGLLYEGRGELDRARKVLEEAALATPDSVDLLLDLARVAHKAKDLRGALGYLAHARDLQPGNAQVHFFFGMVCVGMDLGVEAYNSLKEAVRLEPENAIFNYALGAVSIQRRDPAEALPYFRKYAALRPDDPRGSFAIGVAAFKSGDFRTAREELVRVAGKRETAAGANYFLARIAREENDLDEALRRAQKAIEAEPAYPDPHAELGLIYLRKREFEKSEQALRRCLELDPDSHLGNYHLLMLYQRTKDAREPAQARRFEELERQRDKKADEFLRLIEVRPY